MSDNSSEPLLFEVDQGVATLTLNRPAVKNAIDQGLREQLRLRLRSISDDRLIKAVVIQGAGPDFCSGGDLRAMNISSAEMGRNRMDDLHHWLRMLIELDRPVIAAVDGVCYGLGFSLALAADFILASTQARFCMPFMKVGLVPDGAALYTLPRAVGLARAKQLFFSAREIGAHQALDMGVVLEVLEREHLHLRAQQLAHSLTHASGIALALTKRMLGCTFNCDLQAMLALESTAQGVAYTSEFHREAVRRFTQRQAPLFQWPAGGDRS